LVTLNPGFGEPKLKDMKNFLLLMLMLCAWVLSAGAQDKPRVFVQGKGSENLTSSGSGGGGKHWGAWGSRSTMDAHDEGMEVTKDLQRNCGGAIVTLNQSNADYTIMLNRESKQNRGLLRSNNQVQVANRAGDILGTSATHTVGNAAKDACQLILADWQSHGPAPVQQSAAPAAETMPPAAAPAAHVTNTAGSADRPMPTEASSVTSSTTVGSGESVGDAARRAKQHSACLEMAKDNPSITCK
jgi:hypothetical protein